MRRGPEPGTRRPTKTMTEKSIEAWGQTSGGVPDWIEALAALVDRDGLRKSAVRVGYSVGAISTVINRRYAGDMARVERTVRGALLGDVVTCPVLGQIGREQCLGWQQKPFAATSSVRAAVYRACRSGCSHSEIQQENSPHKGEE